MTDTVPLETLRAEVRNWLAANAPQGWRAIADHRAFADSQRQWFLKLVEGGYAIPHWPAEWPGGGRSLAEQKVIYEELVRADTPAAAALVRIHLSTRLFDDPDGMGFSEEQKARYLPRHPGR